jgi:Domain of unknown function (DUF4440)
LSADELIELERRGWEALSTDAGADYYRELLTDDALFAFPFGVMLREDALAAIAAAKPWSRFEMSGERVLRLTDDSATVVYSVVAEREGQEEFRATLSTTFVRRNGEWKQAFHQQSF